jgi:hypothetical protein
LLSLEPFSLPVAQMADLEHQPQDSDDAHVLHEVWEPQEAMAAGEVVAGAAVV